LLANDPQFAHRQEAFAAIPYKLDGSGATVAQIVDEIFELIEQATTPLIAEQKKELEELEARVTLTGERGSGRKALQDRHKRQLRKFNTDELRSGLATIAGTYHSLVVSDTHYPEESKYHDAIHRIHTAMGSLGLQKRPDWLDQLGNQADIEKPLVVHIRLGDFRGPGTPGAISATYFRNSIDWQVRQGNGSKIWIFSDEPERMRWSDENGRRIVGSPFIGPEAVPARPRKKEERRERE